MAEILGFYSDQKPAFLKLKRGSFFKHAKNYGPWTGFQCYDHAAQINSLHYLPHMEVLDQHSISRRDHV